MKFKLNQLAFAGTLTFISASVSAAGFQIFQQNASGLGNAYAGSGVNSENASVMFFNPAAITELKGMNITAGASVTSSSIKFSNDGQSSVDGLSNAGNGGNAGTTSVIPNFFMSKQIDDKLTLGLGVSVPFGSHSKFDDPFIGGAQALEFHIKSLNINPNAAWKLNEIVSLGFGLNIQQFDAKYRRITGTNPARMLPPPLSTTVDLTTGRTEMNLDDTSIGWNAGAMFKLDQNTKLGISYRSKIKHTVKGSLATGGVSPDNIGATAGINATNPGSATIELPDMAFLSISHKLDQKVELLGDVSWTGWSSIPKIDVVNTNTGSTVQTLETKFRDSFRFAVGANYQYSSNMKLKFGAAYDMTPVKGADTRLVSLPDNDRIWLSTGFQWQKDKSNVFDFGLARVFIKDSSIYNDQRASARGLVSGNYKSSAWLMGAQYSHSF